MSLCLNFIIICYLLPFTIFLLLYQAGKSIILNCLLNQRFVFLLTARTNYENFNIRFKEAVLSNNIEASSKFFALTNLSVSKVSYYVILILIYTSSLLQSICSDIFSFSSLFVFFFACMFYQYICTSLIRLFYSFRRKMSYPAS